MNTLTSVLNYGALIALSCCNAVLQIAASPSCGDPERDSQWPSCAPDGSIPEAGGDDVGRDWQIDGGRVCLRYDPGYRSQPECGAFEVHRGTLYLVEGEGVHRPVDSGQWMVQSP